MTPSFVAAVVGLTFNATSHSQEGVFSVSVGAVTPPPGGMVTYAWGSLNNALTFDSPTSASTTAHASGTGIFYATCTVNVYQIDNSGDTPAYTEVNSGSGSSECAAIGGPITTSVAGAPSNTPTYNHDGNVKTASWYLTYYGYSHASPTPAGGEPTQNATMVIGSQPVVGVNPDNSVKGTTISWTLPGSTYSADSLVTKVVADPQNPNNKVVQQPLTVHLSAEGAFKDGKPVVMFTFNDGVISGSAPDESKDTMVPQGSAPNQTYVSLAYKVSGHVPGKPLVDAGDDQEGTHSVSQPNGSTYWTNAQWYRYILHDTDGAAMPGVWVQERFTDNNPLGLTVNTSGNFWTAALIGAVDSGSPNAKDGIFTGSNGNNWDVLRYVWPSGDSADKTTYHAYYAGNSDATYNATTGIYLGTATITFAAGTPGTASQTSP